MQIFDDINFCVTPETLSENLRIILLIKRFVGCCTCRRVDHQRQFPFHFPANVESLAAKAKSGTETLYPSSDKIHSDSLRFLWGVTSGANIHRDRSFSKKREDHISILTSYEKYVFKCLFHFPIQCVQKTVYFKFWWKTCIPRYFRKQLTFVIALLCRMSAHISSVRMKRKPLSYVHVGFRFH